MPKNRKYLRQTWMLCIACLSASFTMAQEIRDTVKLKEFEVVASFSVNNIGFKKVRMDSSILLPRINADLSTILTQYSTLFIKTYGNGSLATPSFRGTSAHHTVVEWNGISLNSPMLGQTDLSQLPVSQFDGIEILYGGAGIFSSGGAFGGIINLVTNPDWNNKLNITLAQTIASFSTFSTNLNAAAGTNRFQSITKVNYTTSRNDFKFYDNNLDTVRRLENGSYYRYGISEDLFFRLKEKHFLTVKLWYNRNFVNLPPIISVPPAYDVWQEDEAFRSIAEYKFLEKKYNLTVRSAFIDDYLRYKDTTVDARHKYYSSLNRIRFNWLGFKKLTVKTGIDFNYDWVRSDQYDDLKTQLLTGLFGEVVYDALKNLKLSLILREDFVDDDLMPFIFAAGIEYKPLKKLNWSLSANVSRNYREPTLNDKYWSGSGNPDLKQESGLTVEGGSVINLLTWSNRLFMEGQLTGYYSWINNLIVWQPVSNNSYLWSPVNLKGVRSRGLEAGLNAKFMYHNWEITLNSDYNYCRSTTEEVAGGDTTQVGKQLIYIPVNTLKATLNIGWKKFYLSYNFVFTSRRYTSTDNETYMPGYNLSNIFLGKSIVLNKFVLSLQLDINNLFDLDYQSIANRPMPGRNYAVTLRGNFRK